MRRRRWQRRGVQIGALAACFLAGMAVMGVWQGIFNKPEENQRADAAPFAVSADRENDKNQRADAVPLAEPTLLDLEWRAFDSRENRAALYFAVAKRYLEERQDYEAALRCYRQALDAAGQEELAIRPDDNWFVMALKEARQKENNDATVNP